MVLENLRAKRELNLPFGLEKFGHVGEMLCKKQDSPQMCLLRPMTKNIFLNLMQNFQVRMDGL